MCIRDRYAELEAFAKFGSDLDKATLQQLRRGARLVELLKQGQYVPMTVEKQVVSLFAGTNGYLDEIPVSEVQRFERELLELLELKHPEVLTGIASKKDLTDEITASLKKILGEFTASFKASVKA